MPLDSLSNKIKSFNCNCISIRDGHSFKHLIPALRKKIKNKPTVIIANTIKGSGWTYVRGDTRIDDGAIKALKQGKSLLAAGVKSIEGSFNKGDQIKIVGKKIKR